MNSVAAKFNLYVETEMDVSSGCSFEVAATLELKKQVAKTDNISRALRATPLTDAD